MAQGQGSGGKIAIGCCSALAAVVIIAIAVIAMFAPKVFDKVKEVFRSQEEYAEALQTWDGTMQEAGGDAGAASPSAFAGFTRDRQSNDANPRGLDLGKTGHLAEYFRDGTSVSVWTTQANSLEQEAMDERISTQNDERFSVKSSGSITSGGVTSISYSGSPPKEKGLMVLYGDWVIFLQTNDQELDLKELLEEYVATAASAVDEEAGESGAAEPEPEASAEEVDADADAADAGVPGSAN